MSDQGHPSGAPRRNLYGRRKGKGLRQSQQRYLAEDLAELRLDGVDRDANLDRQAIDLKEFAGGREVWLEIGFGGGEHLVHQAATHPEAMLVGCEHYVNGVAMLLGKIRAKRIDNIAIHPGDVRDLLDVLPPASLSKAFLLYPDPWPKKRHHRRRFVTPEHLQPLARAMAPGAEFRLATDIPDYVRQALERIVPGPHFQWLARRCSDWRQPWEDWSPTRYEQKALREGRTPHYLTFRRTGAPA